MKFILALIYSYAILFLSVGAQSNPTPIKLVLAPQKNVICFGRSAPFTVKVINIRDRFVAIDTNRIGYSSMYSWFESTKAGSEGETSMSTGDQGKGYSPNIVVLPPRKAYVMKKQFSFDDDFFSRSRNFKMRIGYGQFLKLAEYPEAWVGDVDSNDINIHVQACGQTSKQVSKLEPFR